MERRFWNDAASDAFVLYICDDLIPGILLYEKGEQAKACCLWQNSWEIHWGTHAVNAMQVLHAYLTQPDYLKVLKADCEEFP